MSYLVEPKYEHGTPEKTGVLLVNLGTPEAPTGAAVRPYLKEFLGDPRVVEIPKLVWWFILNGIILNTRPKKSAEKYASIWMKDGSPLKIYTEKQTKLLAGFLSKKTDAPLLVEYAMRYGNPSIPSALAKLKAQNCQRILIVPMYPQYAASTTATACDMVFKELLKVRNVPAIRTVKHFHDNVGYIQALANNVNKYWQSNGRPDKLLISFHGLPRYTLDKGDPYFCECQKTGRLLAEALSLTKEQYQISFQSRFGKAEWLKPYTTATLTEFAKQGIERVDVVCPGFVSDCLETLEEIALEGKHDFLTSGGKEYHYIPCLNDNDDWIDALSDLVLENLHGWLMTSDPKQLAQSRERALQLL